MISRHVLQRLLATTCFAFAAAPVLADGQQVSRGAYLVAIAGCTDCHTPGHFLGKPDMARFLGGSDVGFAMPGAGIFFGPNLTPDRETGLGSWTDQQIVTAMTKGVRPDGRALVPAMPFAALSRLTESDALAIVAYLKSLPAVRNRVAGPIGPDQKATGFVLSVMPADAYNALPRPSPAK